MFPPRIWETPMDTAEVVYKLFALSGMVGIFALAEWLWITTHLK